MDAAAGAAGAAGGGAGSAGTAFGSVSAGSTGEPSPSGVGSAPGSVVIAGQGTRAASMRSISSAWRAPIRTSLIRPSAPMK